MKKIKPKTALALMSRRSTTHRRIINDKADYISGKGVVCDTASPLLARFIETVNGDGESLRQLLNKLAYDKSLFGNAFLEVVTDARRSFLSLYHQDASRCRLAKDSAHVLLHHDWAAFRAEEARTLRHILTEKQAFLGPWTGRNVDQWIAIVRTREMDTLAHVLAMETEAFGELENMLDAIDWPSVPNFFRTAVCRA